MTGNSPKKYPKKYWMKSAAFIVSIVVALTVPGIAVMIASAESSAGLPSLRLVSLGYDLSGPNRNFASLGSAGPGSSITEQLLLLPFLSVGLRSGEGSPSADFDLFYAPTTFDSSGLLYVGFEPMWNYLLGFAGYIQSFGLVGTGWTLTPPNGGSENGSTPPSPSLLTAAGLKSAFGNYALQANAGHLDMGDNSASHAHGLLRSWDILYNDTTTIPNAPVSRDLASSNHGHSEYVLSDLVPETWAQIDVKVRRNSGLSWAGGLGRIKSLPAYIPDGDLDDSPTLDHTYINFGPDLSSAPNELIALRVNGLQTDLTVPGEVQKRTRWSASTNYTIALPRRDRSSPLRRFEFWVELPFFETYEVQSNGQSPSDSFWDGYFNSGPTGYTLSKSGTSAGVGYSGISSKWTWNYTLSWTPSDSARSVGTESFRLTADLSYKPLGFDISGSFLSIKSPAGDSDQDGSNGSGGQPEQYILFGFTKRF